MYFNVMDGRLNSLRYKAEKINIKSRGKEMKKYKEIKMMYERREMFATKKGQTHQSFN